MGWWNSVGFRWMDYEENTKCVRAGERECERIMIAKGWKRRRVLAGIVGVVTLAIASAAAQGTPSAPSTPVEEEKTAIPMAPVELDGMTLFAVRGLSVYPAEKRAQDIAARIREIAANPAYSPQSLKVEDGPLATRIVAGNEFIMNVFDPDARLERVSRQVLAQAYVSRMRGAIENFRRDRQPEMMLRRILHALGATLVVILVLWAGHRLVRKARSALERRYRERIHGVQVQSFQIIRAEHVWRLLNGALSLLWAVVALAATYLGLHYVLSLFPWTRGFANRLFDLLVTPLAKIGASMLAAVPDVIFLSILVLVTRYVLKLIRLFFAGIETGAITFSGFAPEWAKPTYRLVRIAVVAFALVAAYPYIPGSNSQAFKGITLLIGVIFSLGSTALIGNMLSGYTVTYRRVFKPGDRIKVGEHIGDVQDTKLLVTYLRTPKNEIIAVPNSAIINGEVINYSTLAQKEGLILHTTVGIGYETSWRQVEAMLLQAAEATPGLLREPKPFVLQKELGDFAVTYEINAYCDQPQTMERLYTALHKNILDAFNEYGVQIMTPAYETDPQQAKIVPKDQWYAAPASSRDHLAVSREPGTAPVHTAAEASGQT